MNKTITIFGASGYLGSHLFEYFSKKTEVIGTHYNSPKKGTIYFDLENPDLNLLNLKDTKIGIICSAITKLGECKKNEEKAYNLNVKGTKKLIQQLFDLNIIPVFLSSSYVFNGKKGNYTELDETNARNVYGIHKKLIEDFLKETKEDYLIARISKVFGLTPKDGTLFTSIAEELMEDKTIYSATDQMVSPLYIGDLIKIIDKCLEKELFGIYNIASPESFSRDEIAKMIKSKLQIKKGKIISCKIKDLDFLDYRPLDTSLNLEKLLGNMDFEFTKVSECLNKLKYIY